MFQALAWPVVALVAVIVFRRELSRLLARLEHVKAFSVEAQFGQQLSDLKTLVEPTRAKDAPTSTAAGTPLVDGLAPVAKIAPATAIVDAYTRVEEALRQLLVMKGVTKVYQTSTPELVRLAAGTNLLTPQTVQAFLGLGVLRNLAIHGGDTEISTEKAMEYLALSDGVLFSLQQDNASLTRPTS
jgi:hypothetical protein